MSDTYNENEIAKLKHLNEFARQLNIKLDGGTDPKTARSVVIQYQHKVGTTVEWVNTPADGVINIPLSEVNGYVFRLLITTPLDVVLKVQNITDTETLAAGISTIGYGGSKYYTDRINKWEICLVVNAWNQTPFTARTVTFNLHFDKTDKYDVFDKTITINITEE